MIDYVSVAPVTEPVTVEDFKQFARISTDDDDAQIKRMIVAARKWCEDYQHRAYVTQTRVMKLDYFPPVAMPIEALRTPLASVTSIAYIDEAGTSQTWSSAKYQVDVNSIPPRVLPVYNEWYPSTQYGTVNAVTITYVAGAAVSAVSEMVKEAILRIAKGLYDGCSMEVATGGAVLSLLDMERTWVPS